MKSAYKVEGRQSTQKAVNVVSIELEMPMIGMCCGQTDKRMDGNC